MDPRHARILAALVFVVAGTVVFGVLGACAPTPPAPSDSGTSEPTSSVEPTSTAAPSGPGVLVYFHFGEELVAVHRTVDAPTEAIATAAMTELLEGPSADESADGLGSEVPEGTSLLGIVVEDGTATVDLSDAFDSGGGSLSMTMRVAQVVFTLTQFDTVDSVVFEMDGRPVEALGGEGLVLSDAQSREDWEDLSPPVLIESPAWGEAIDGTAPIEIAGTANVFEAEFDIDVVASGGTLASTHVVATSGTGTRGVFRATVALPDYAPGEVRVLAWYSSPRDGSREDLGEVRAMLTGGE